jgi:hypothetical protein
MERVRLITVPWFPAPLQSDRYTLAAITRPSEGELLSPAEGMRAPYPNQNVRIARSDDHFALFNVRLHLGGGLGASLWREETLGRIYLVVSLLLITPRTYTLPAEFTPLRRLPVLPPTPFSSGEAGAEGLPSFSFIAAVADGPAQLETMFRRSPSNYSSEAPAQIPPTSRMTRAYSNNPRNAPTSPAYLPPPRSPSLLAAYRQPMGYPVDYPASAQVPAQTSSQGVLRSPPRPSVPPSTTDPDSRQVGARR